LIRLVRQSRKLISSSVIRKTPIKINSRFRSFRRILKK